jgi:phage I-like protein
MVRCAGLSNLPNLELTALACQQASPLEEIPMANDAKTGDAAKDNASAGAPAEPDTTLASLRTTFGLPADADGAAIAAHAQELMAKAVQPAQPPAPPDPARYVPMEAFAALQSQVADMVKQSQTSAAQAAVQAATEAGKLPPAMHSWAQGYAEQNLAGFTAWAASAPVLVSAHAQGVGGQTATPPASTPGLTAEQTAVCAQLGLSAEAFSQQLGGDR